jgi:uncharacterized membrane protein
VDRDEPFDGRGGAHPDPRLREQYAELVEVTQSYTGPIPPSVLREYDDLVPGFAQRYLLMTERAVTGHIDRDDKLAEAEVDLGKTGQALAFGLTLIAMTAAIVFFAVGNNVAGLAFLSVPLLLLIRSFLPGGGSKEPE